MRFGRGPEPAVKTKLVEDVITAWVRNAPRLTEQAPALQVALIALDKDLQRVNREQKKLDDEEAAEKKREDQRKNPPVSVQKVMAIIRKAGLTVASYEHRIGTSTGLRVSYGDWDRRTWVKVDYSFAWDFGYLSKEQIVAEEKKLVKDELFGTAMRALQAKGLSAEPVREGTNHRIHYLKVAA